MRFTLGHTTTDADVDRALAVVADAVGRRLRDRRVPGTSRAHRRRWQNPGMRVLVAMSGGVDSSVAAALLAEPGHEVVGATLKLWGGPSDSGCCSVADVDDARRVAQQLGIAHHVFNMADEFEAAVVAPYVAAHAAGRTPNPCIECNRHIKFDRLLERATGWASTRWPPATTPGWRARGAGAPTGCAGGPTRTRTSPTCCRCWARPPWPGWCCRSGDLTKAEVRAQAAGLGLRTADKPDSQDVCFIHAGRRARRASSAGASPCTRPTVVDGGQRRGGRDGRGGGAGDRRPAPGDGPRRRRAPALRRWPSTCARRRVVVGGRDAGRRRPGRRSARPRSPGWPARWPTAAGPWPR